MKRINRRLPKVGLLLLVFALTLASLPLAGFGEASAGNEGANLYIAPWGRDENPGTAEAPLATLAGARDALRAIKEREGLPAGGVKVYIREGTYSLSDTLYFDERDSGTEEAPITYAAYPGENPVFTGGAYLPGSAFAEVSDPAILTRLTPEAAKMVRSCNLFDLGFTPEELDYAKDYWQEGNLRENSGEQYASNSYIVPRMQVFIDDEALYPARWPNKTPGIFADNPYDQYLMIQEVLERGFDFVTEEYTGKPCVFRTNAERIKNWASYEDIAIIGMTGWEFFQTEILAEAIDPEAMTVTLRTTPTSGVIERGRYAFSNVLEELDTPGEYYIHKDTGMLYLYPTGNLDTATVKVSRLEAPFMIEAKNASFLTFSGLTFELTKGSVFHITGGDSCAVTQCTLKNYGIYGVRLGEFAINTANLADAYGTPHYEALLAEHPAAENGYRHSITKCRFLNTGYGAADIAAGHVASRTSGETVFSENTIIHSGLIGSCYFSGIVLNGCGITVTNNSFFFCRGQAIWGDFIDTRIEYNEFCDSPSDMAEDTCAIYCNYRCLNDGVSIRYNYFHDITNRGHLNIGFDYARRAAAGYDNAQPFKDFSYNVVYNVPYIYSNPMNPMAPSTTVNNLFIDCDYVLEYPDEYMRDRYDGEDGLEIISSFDTLPLYYLSGLYKDPLWKQNYPALFNFYTYMEEEKKDMTPVMAQVYNNLIVYLEKPMSGRATELPERVAADGRYGRVENNYFLYNDPGFADAACYDFQLSRETCAALGIDWIDMASIGSPEGYSPLRVSDQWEDPLALAPAGKQIGVEVQWGAPFVMVSLWRQVAYGQWVWAADAPLNSECATSFPAKAGGVYTVQYHGDERFPAQFMGGSQAPFPEDEFVETFTVTEDRDRWDYYVFQLRGRE